MSGGVAYVWNPDQALIKQCNMDTFELEPVQEAADVAQLKELISRHQRYTGSTVAADILANWDHSLRHFAKVMPSDYKRVLAEREVVSRIHAVAV